MSRQSGDPNFIPSSSIALLQERFRQLQRAKEMREERELLRLFPNSEAVNPAIFNEPSRLLFTSESIFPPTPPLQASLSQSTNLQRHHTDIQAIESPMLANLGSSTVTRRSSNPDDSDVDTSLHL